MDTTAIKTLETRITHLEAAIRDLQQPIADYTARTRQLRRKLDALANACTRLNTATWSRSGE